MDTDLKGGECRIEFSWKNSLLLRAQSMVSPEPEYIAVLVQVEKGRVHLELTDGSTHSFPVVYYPRLASASEESLREVQLRVGGRALRWKALDEDIWIADAIMQR